MGSAKKRRPKAGPVVLPRVQFDKGEAQSLVAARAAGPVPTPGGYSAALVAYLQVLGIGGEVAPANASGGVLARQYAAAAAGSDRPGKTAPNPLYNFATRNKDGSMVAAAERRRRVKEAVARLSKGTELFVQRVRAREAERVKEERAAALRRAPRSKSGLWHARQAAAASVARSTGDEAAIEYEVWSAKLQDRRKAEEEDSRSNSLARQTRRRQLQQHPSAASLLQGRATDARPFAMLSARQHSNLLRRAEARPLFLATWKFLEDVEREFAAALYLQSWARRRVLHSQPDAVRGKAVVLSLLDALFQVRNAKPRWDRSKDPPRRFYTLSPHEEEEIESLFGRRRKKKHSRRNLGDRLGDVSPTTSGEDEDDDEDDEEEDEEEEEEEEEEVPSRGGRRASVQAPGAPAEEKPAAQAEDRRRSSRRRRRRHRQREEEDDDDDDDELPELVLHKILPKFSKGKGVYVEPNSGYSYPLFYELGPPPRDEDEDDSPPHDPANLHITHREKAKQDFVLVLRTFGTLPTRLARVLPYLDRAGWNMPSPLEWQRIAHELVALNAIQVAQKANGEIFEAWLAPAL